MVRQARRTSVAKNVAALSATPGNAVGIGKGKTPGNVVGVGTVNGQLHRSAPWPTVLVDHIGDSARYAFEFAVLRPQDHVCQSRVGAECCYQASMSGEASGVIQHLQLTEQFPSLFQGAGRRCVQPLEFFRGDAK